MCLYIRCGEHTIHKAKNDITCYKLLLEAPNNTLQSPYRGMLYRLNRVYRLWNFTGNSSDGSIYKTFRFRLPQEIDEVSQGFHSYATLESALNWRGASETVLKCRIPKGTRYILGKGNEIVSLKLELLEIVRGPKRNQIR